jgi:exoribonuclease R
MQKTIGKVKEKTNRGNKTKKLNDNINEQPKQKSVWEIPVDKTREFSTIIQKKEFKIKDDDLVDVEVCNHRKNYNEPIQYVLRFDCEQRDWSYLESALIDAKHNAARRKIKNINWRNTCSNISHGVM